jgi:HSP20 family molecular chaperone IbpA
LSIKYPQIEHHLNRNIALLDSAGLETPVLKGKQKKHEENYIEGETSNIIINEKGLFKEKCRDKIITELFLQNYIINTSEILIVVVGILTYSEQKLLNRIRTEMQRAKLKKTLYVIHNLITYTSINQVKEYIKDYLLKSATFHLIEGHKISTSEKQETGEYYYEKNSEPKIFHLIYANEGSEAGNYYNNYTLKFIENSYLTVTDLKNFDIIESIKERFIEISKEIIEKSEPLEKTDFCKNDKDNYKLIKLNDEKEITLKKCLIDELGFSNLKARGFEPTYNFYKHPDGKTIIIRVEAPGNSEMKSKIEYRGENTIIQLSGKKNQDIEPKELKDNIFNTREFGDFFVDIPLKTEDYKILNEKPKIRNVSGLFIIEYKLEDKVEESEVFGTKQLV